MKNRFNLIIFTLIVLFTSCNKEEVQEKVPVQLTFNTRSASENNDALLGEGIQSIRVIIVQNGTVVKHEYYPNLSTDATLTSRTFTIFDVPVGKEDFYIIANGEQSGITDWTPYAVGKTPSFNTLTQHIMTTANGVIEAPFPITGQFLNKEVSTNGMELEFQITRSVVKLNFTFTNTSNESITLERIKPGAFIANQSFLFPQSSLPDGEIYSSLDINNLNITILPGESTTKTIYLYENAAAENTYTVSIVANGYTYSPLPLKIVSSEASLSSMPRNTQININMSITPSEIGLSYIVKDWEDILVEIPSYN